MNTYEQAKKIKVKSIWGIVVFFTLIGIIVTMVLDIVCTINIMSNDWKDEELNDSAMLWGLLTLLAIGPIASLIFANKVIKKHQDKINDEDDEKN